MSHEDKVEWQDYLLRAPCRICGLMEGKIHWDQNGQDIVYCNAGHHAYNAPKIETGRVVRSLTTVRLVSPGQRYRVMERAHFRCELCSSVDNLCIAHVLSVRDGFDFLTDAQLNSDENLMVLCAECNSGQRSSTLPLWLFAAILKRRTEKDG